MKKIIAISGSLREKSVNTMLLKAVQKQAPAGMEIEQVEIGNLPIFNEDIEYTNPAKVLKEKIDSADGIIFVTPEYNRSVPAALKNAIDWASRPSEAHGKNSFAGKTVLVMGASSGPIGTAVGQQDVKKSMLHLDALVIGQPEFFLGNAYDKFNEAGELIDESTKAHIENALMVLMSKCLGERNA